MSAETKAGLLIAEWNDICRHIGKEGYVNATDVIKKAGLYIEGYAEPGMQDRIRMVAKPKPEIPLDLD